MVERESQCPSVVLRPPCVRRGPWVLPWKPSDKWLKTVILLDMLVQYCTHFSKLPGFGAGFFVNGIFPWPSRSSFTCRRTLRKMKIPGTSPIKRRCWKTSLRKTTTIETASFLPRNTMCTNMMSYKSYFFVSKLLYFALKKKSLFFMLWLPVFPYEKICVYFNKHIFGVIVWSCFANLTLG